MTKYVSYQHYMVAKGESKLNNMENNHGHRDMHTTAHTDMYTFI